LLGGCVHFCSPCFGKPSVARRYNQRKYLYQTRITS
jgi:hypothetical protein